MNKLFFPAIFEEDENGSFSVTFPDVPGAVTGADSIEKTYEMAQDALGFMLSYMYDKKEPIPKPSAPKSIELQDNQFVVVVEFDLTAYKKKHSGKAVKKTVTIPEWLNEEATAMGVNFSQVLQNALVSIVSK